MTSSMARATGIAWYRQEEYARLKKLFKDGRKLPDTFAVWHKKASALHDNLKAPVWDRRLDREFEIQNSYAESAYAQQGAQGDGPASGRPATYHLQRQT
jgi:hypothetical protein